MRSGNIPFRFDIRNVLRKMRRFAKNHAGSVTLNLPYLSVSINAGNREKQIARELVTRLKDRRVLNAWECCDNCIDQALASLQEMRRLLVDKQVALSDIADGPVYLIAEAMAQGIRQFLTYEQRLVNAHDGPRGVARDGRIRQQYFDALELLRAHISRCLIQVAAIAGIDVSGEGLIRNYQGPWQIEVYDAFEIQDT